jgi:hypothetical protein
MFIAMVTFGNLSADKLGAKFISMGCDDNSVVFSTHLSKCKSWCHHKNEGECDYIFDGNTFFCLLNQFGCVGFYQS